MYQEIKNIKSNDKANVEIDLGEIADYRSQLNEKQENEPDDKFVLEVQSPPNNNLVQKNKKVEATKKTEVKATKKAQATKVDTSIPKWPIYKKPMSQQDAIKKELAKVKEQHTHWGQLLSQAEQAVAKVDQTDDSALKTQMLHNVEVDKIKVNIFNDRINFLQKILTLSEKVKQKNAKLALGQKPISLTCTKVDEREDPVCRIADVFETPDGKDCKPGDPACADNYEPGGDCKLGELGCADNWEPEGAETCAPG